MLVHARFDLGARTKDTAHSTGDRKRSKQPGDCSSSDYNANGIADAGPNAVTIAVAEPDWNTDSGTQSGT